MIHYLARFAIEGCPITQPTAPSRTTSDRPSIEEESCVLYTGMGGPLPPALMAMEAILDASFFASVSVPVRPGVTLPVIDHLRLELNKCFFVCT